MVKDDKALFDLISRERDSDAFSQLFLRWYTPLVGFAMRLVDRSDAEDIVQEVMAGFWENSPKIIIRNAVSTYLFSAVKNRCLTLVNRDAIKGKVFSNLYLSLMDQTCDDVTVHTQYNELVVKYKAALLALPEVQRKAFELHRYEGKSYKEIAEIQGVTAKTVEYRISQVLAKLRTALVDYSPMLILLLLKNF